MRALWRLASWLAAAWLVPVAALAEDHGPPAGTPALSLEEFETFVTGKTLTWAFEGQAYASESYGAGRRVTARLTGEPCVDGQYYAQGPEICFDFDDTDQTYCWIMWRAGDVVMAKMNGTGAPLVSGTLADRPLSCPLSATGVRY